MKTLSENSNLADLGDIFDLTGEKVSALFGVFSTSGGNLREAQESLATFNQRINDALSGKGKEAQELFRELNVGAHEFAQLDVADRFYTLIDAVQKSTSPLGKLNLLMKAVGEDGGKNLSRILPLSTEEIKKVGETAKITNEQLQQSREAFRAFQQIGAAASNIWRKTVAAIAPALKIIADFVKENVDAAYEWINNNIKLSKSIKDVAKEFTDWLRNLTPETKSAIGAMIALTAAIGLVTAAIVTAGVVFNFFFGGIGIWAGIIATAVAATGLWVYHVGSLRKAWLIAKRAAEDFWAFIKPALPALGALLVAVTAYFAPITAALILVAVYWEDVTEAAEEFYEFIRPTLRETWDLIKKVGFAVRDGLIRVWDDVQAAVARTAKSIGNFLNINVNVDWNRVKYQLRDFMIFAQFIFDNVGVASRVLWLNVKAHALEAFDEILKRMFIVPVVIIGGFVYMAKVIKSTFVNLLVSLANGVDTTVKAIWEAIKSGKAIDITEQIKASFANAVLSGAKELDEFKQEIEKKVGKISFENIERDGIKIPVGLNVEGLQKERQRVFDERNEANKFFGMEFDEYKMRKLRDNQIKDTQSIISDVFRDLILPGFFRIEQEAGNAGKKSGMNFMNEFGKEAKKLDAVLFNSAEAMSRIDEYREAREQERSQRPSSTFRRADDNLAIIRVLEQIAANTLTTARREGIEIVSAGVP